MFVQNILQSCFTSFYIAVPLLVLAVTYSVLLLWISLTQDTREPPLVMRTLPFWEPVLNIIIDRYKFFIHARDKYGQSIQTLRLPWCRLYLVNSNSLIAVVQKETRAVSFAPIESQATAAVLGTSEATNQIMAHDPGSDYNHFSSFRRAIGPVLARGPCLDSMFEKSFQTMSCSLDERLTRQEKSEVNLFAWTGHEITLAGTNAEYGEANPFRDPQVEQAWKKYISGLPVFILGIFPRIFARESFQAREMLYEKFLSYFEEGHHHHQSSGAVLTRLEHNTTSGMPLKDTARGEIGACMALLNNTIPGVFWLIYHIYSDPAVLEDVRNELLANAVRLSDGDGMRILDLSRVRSACPVLKSTMQEVFRFRGIGTGMVRRVLEDHLLDGQYLLKKGSLLFAPNSVQHLTAAHWGPDFAQFDHRRFLKSTGKSNMTSSALRTFGGGSTHCPGRHFASGQLVGFAAMVVLRTDIRPVEGRKWIDVTATKSFGLGIASGFLSPDDDLQVEISSTGMQNWRIEL